MALLKAGGNVGTDAVLHRFNNPDIEKYVDIAATARGSNSIWESRCAASALKSLGCRQVRFEPGSLADIGENVIAVGGGYDAPVASVAQGGLRFRHTEKGLEWEADIPQDANGEKILSAAEIAPVVGRPYIDVEASAKLRKTAKR